jgi:hypothetical protein
MQFPIEQLFIDFIFFYQYIVVSEKSFEIMWSDIAVCFVLECNEVEKVNWKVISLVF